MSVRKIHQHPSAPQKHWAKYPETARSAAILALKKEKQIQQKEEEIHRV
jgi:hypothetical protein